MIGINVIPFALTSDQIGVELYFGVSQDMTTFAKGLLR